VTAESTRLLALAYAEHRGYVRRCLRRAGLPRDALDDGVHEVFAVLVRRIADLRDDSSLRQWLAGISRNVAWAHHRRARRRVVALAGTEAVEASAVDLRIDLARSLARLDHSQRRAVLLADGEGLSAQEVAVVQGVPLTTAQWWIRCARARLRSTLERTGAVIALVDPRRWLVPCTFTAAALVVAVAMPTSPPVSDVPGDVASTPTTPRSPHVGALAGADVATAVRVDIAPTTVPTGSVGLGDPHIDAATPSRAARAGARKARARKPSPGPQAPADSSPTQPSARPDAKMVGHVAIELHRVGSGRAL
jgi:RNA polymerase sigma-70 factor (ECF subfamily)